MVHSEPQIRFCHFYHHLSRHSSSPLLTFLSQASLLTSALFSSVPVSSSPGSFDPRPLGSLEPLVSSKGNAWGRMEFCLWCGR